MLNAKYNLRGITLVEVLVAVAIVAILFAAAAPDFSQWIQNTKIRTAAESIQNGLNLAKSEAVHRNATAQFISCGADGSWDVISASAPASTNICNSGAVTNGWIRIQSSRVQSQATNSLIDISQSPIGFNGLGRQVSTTDLVGGGATPNPPVAVSINVGTTLALTAGAECACPAGTCGYPVGIASSSSGTMRCLRIVVSSGGLMRMCDPALPANTPQGC